MRRQRLRTRVLLLTTMFALSLFAVTLGLSWRATDAQQRWTQLVAVESRSITSLEELIRAQNGFHARYASGAESPDRYGLVAQLLTRSSLPDADYRRIQSRIDAFHQALATPSVSRSDLDAMSGAIVIDARELVEARKQKIARQLPALERETRSMMASSLAVAWILVLLSFAAVQITLAKVVTPIERLSSAADRIAAGDLTARAPVAGDREIATLGTAINRMADELKSRARTDELTGLPNFRAFRERIEGEIERAERYPERFGILVLDLDRFKKYNDTFGHLAGNDALRRVAAAIREVVRAVDFPARYGGEEFAVIVPQVDAVGLAAIAERIRHGVEILPAPAGAAAVTVSVGGALYPDDGRDLDVLFAAADARLYEAKKRGRNRVVSPGQPQAAARA